MLAFITNLSLGEVFAILVMAVLIFGRRLPEVAARGAVHMQRLRRGMQDFRRESGFDEEIRKARRMIENPVKSVFEETKKEPASWRPPSPRIEAHPDTISRSEEVIEEAEVLSESVDDTSGEVVADASADVPTDDSVK